MFILGDEFMFFISYHFERSTKMYVTWKSAHDPNRLCISIQKKILNNAPNLGRALAYHILLKAMMYFIYIIICRSFDLYVVINYQKVGD